jgi:sugar phosphate isomerase/epimerase
MFSLKALLLTVLSLLTINLVINGKVNAQVLTEKPMPLIGVQLWSVKHEVKRDFKGTLQKIADMGYQGVEFARDYGPYANDGLALKKHLHSIGLQVSGTHIELTEFSSKNFAASVDFYQQLGSPFLILAWDKRAWDKTQVQAFTQEIIALASKLKLHGLLLGFHNHDQEFNAFLGATFWDYIINTVPDYMPMQLDIGWVTYVDRNPVDFINDRTLTTHYRPRSPITETDKAYLIGEDNTDWHKVLKANIAVGTKWLIVELTDYPEGLTPMQSIEQSKQGLDRIVAEVRK